MPSSIPAFKAALKSRLAADPALSGEHMMVSWGNPHPARPTRELVAIGSAARTSLDLVGGLDHGSEEYTLAVLISVIGAVQESMEVLSARAYELADVINSSVLTWRETGYDGFAMLVVPEGSTDAEDVDGTTREMSLELTFSVTASVSYREG